MSQDVVADALNNIMNAKKAGKKEVIIKRYSKLLLRVLDIAMKDEYLSYKIEGKELKITIKNVNMIRAIKPRYTAPVKKINDYARRFLPSKNFGYLIISTSKGLMKHYEAEKEHVGGCLIAYVY